MQENSPVLPRIHGTEDVRKLNMEELEQLCRDVRARLLQTVSQTGGHLSSNLGVVELTVALHHTFCLPHDQIVWDVGHQCYTHKLLTGRNDRFDTLRQEGGLSGFPCPAESPCDVFVAGHSSTSVSAALGMAEAKALSGDDGYVVAVIGDGALTGGLAYEGLSNAGRSKDRLIVILNDNGMSINANVGFVARHLAVLRARPSYLRLKNGFARAVRHIPLIGKPLHRALLHTKMNLKRSLYKESSWFEQLGFYYLGPIDGHSLPALLNALQSAREITGPVLLHVETKKGKGYTPAERSPDRFHGVSPFDPATGETAPPPSVSFSHVFGEELTRLAEKDSRICAITAAMTDGTGLSEFARRFRNRCFDVGIAEEHAVTFSSGLARNGMLPVFAVYSPFLQRCYDQLLNDTALNHTHIVLAVRPIRAFLTCRFCSRSPALPCFPRRPTASCGSSCTRLSTIRRELRSSAIRKDRNGRFPCRFARTAPPIPCGKSRTPMPFCCPTAVCLPLRRRRRRDIPSRWSSSTAFSRAMNS